MNSLKNARLARAMHPLSIWDAFGYSLVLLFCFFVFQHGDMLHTAGSSFTYLNGHILDFYEANQPAFVANNYLPTTYVIFAIWSIPVRLLGIVTEPTMDLGFLVFWYKLLTSLFFAGSAYLVYRIGLVIGLSSRSAALMSFLWISTPIAFFSQFIFGQYDVLTAFFTLLGVYFVLKKDLFKFTLSFSIAITLKYFALFVFVPLLLLAEKRFRKILWHGCLVLAPLILQMALYLWSPAFRKGIFGFGVLVRLYEAGFKLVGDAFVVSYFIVAWVLICGYCYLRETADEALYRQWVLYAATVVSSLFFILIAWHPQWVLFVTPFLAMTTFCHGRREFFMLVDVVMMYAFVAFSVNFFPVNVDTFLFIHGLLWKLNPGFFDPQASLLMKDIFRPQNLSLYFSLFVGCLMVHIVFKHPGDQFGSWAIRDGASEISYDPLCARIRFYVGVMIFILPALLCIMAPSRESLKLLLKSLTG